MDFLLSLISDPIDFSVGAVTASSIIGGGVAVRKFRKKKPTFATMEDTLKVSNRHRQGYKNLSEKEDAYRNSIDSVKNEFALTFPDLNFDDYFINSFDKQNEDLLREILVSLNKVDNEHITLKELESLDTSLVNRISHGNGTVSYHNTSFVSKIKKDMKTFATLKPIFKSTLEDLGKRFEILDEGKNKAIEEFDKSFLKDLRSLVFAAETQIEIFRGIVNDLPFAHASEMNEWDGVRKDAEKTLKKAEEYLDSRYNFDKVALLTTSKHRQTLKNLRRLTSERKIYDKAIDSIVEAESYDYKQAQNPEDMLESLLYDYYKYLQNRTKI